MYPAKLRKNKISNILQNKIEQKKTHTVNVTHSIAREPNNFIKKYYLASCRYIWTGTNPEMDFIPSWNFV